MIDKREELLEKIYKEQVRMDIIDDVGFSNVKKDFEEKYKDCSINELKAIVEAETECANARENLRKTKPLNTSVLNSKS